MLENHTLKLQSNDLEEFDTLYVALGLKDRPGLADPVNPLVLQEGYSTTELRAFIDEFRQRLLRLQRVHEAIQGSQTTARGLRQFLHQAQRPCQLSLARYLFPVQDVMQRIGEQLQRSRGVPEPLSGAPFYAANEAAQTMAHLPGYEAAIARQLCRPSDIYWVAPHTQATLHALVESPLTTVVLTIKAPGSDVEFELKRTGMRTPPLLNVIYTRAGERVPPEHRLQGGHMGTLLTWEASAAAHLARFYRLVHGCEAPVSRTLAVNSVYAVPTAHGEAHLLDYLTDPDHFGAGFDAMRQAMAESIAAFDQERSEVSPEMPGALGRTVQFLSYAAPKQSILVHTTSFRLDRLVLYLSPEGPSAYFEKGLHTAYSADDAQRFADELLDEMLGVYTPPGTGYRDHAQYLHDAFAVPANRARADRHYQAIMRQIGQFWGTLLAARGYSEGESFVARNVGLKSVWEQGEWRVKIRFMDHDNLRIGIREDTFDPKLVLSGTMMDACYIFGLDNEEHTIKGEVAFLQEIYRIRPEAAQHGHATLIQAAAEAYRSTQTAIAQRPQLQQFFHPAVLPRLRDWDTLLDTYFKRVQQDADWPAWEADTRQWLAANHYAPAHIDEHIEIINRQAMRLPYLAFLYSPEGSDINRPPPSE